MGHDVDYVHLQSKWNIPYNATYAIYINPLDYSTFSTGLSVGCIMSDVHNKDQARAIL